MPVPLEDHVRQILLERDRGAKFYTAVGEGWRRALDRYPQRDRWRRKSTFRAVVWEEVTDELATIVATDDDIELCAHQDTISVIVENEVLFRLKHADIALTTANYPTPEALAFDDHDKDLYGHRGMQRVRLCYVPDQFETKIAWIGIAAHYKGVFLWNIELDRTGAVAPVVRLPLQEPGLDVTRVARLRRGRDQGNQGEENAG